MNLHDEVQFVGGPLNGQESSVPDLAPEFHFPRLSVLNNWWDSYSQHSTHAEDIYVRLLDTSIYVFKGTIES